MSGPAPRQAHLKIRGTGFFRSVCVSDCVPRHRLALAVAHGVLRRRFLAGAPGMAERGRALHFLAASGSSFCCLAPRLLRLLVVGLGAPLVGAPLCPFYANW